MKITAIIPARGGSKGIPRKNIKEIAGKPLIEWTISSALLSPSINEVIVSTDDEEIMSIARDCGAEVPFKRPAEYADDIAPMNSVIQHALTWYDRLVDRDCPDIFVLLQPTSPLRTVKDIEAVISMVTEKHAVVSVTEVPQHYNYSWQLRINKDNVCVLSTGDALKHIITRRQNLSKSYLRNGSIYAFATSMFRELGTFYGDEPRAYIMPQKRHVNIDTQEDWESAEKILLNQKEILKEARN